MRSAMTVHRTVLSKKVMRCLPSPSASPSANVWSGDLMKGSLSRTDPTSLQAPSQPEGRGVKKEESYPKFGPKLVNQPQFVGE